MYSITSRNSFEEISQFHQQILRVKDKDFFPTLVVANKADLEYERQVGVHGQSQSHPSSLLSVTRVKEGGARGTGGKSGGVEHPRRPAVGQAGFLAFGIGLWVAQGRAGFSNEGEARSLGSEVWVALSDAD